MSAPEEIYVALCAVCDEPLGIGPAGELAAVHATHARLAGVDLDPGTALCVECGEVRTVKLELEDEWLRRMAEGGR